MEIPNQETPEEVWYPIPNVPDYEISTNLRVRSWRIGGCTQRRGNVFHFVKVYNMKNGYPAITARINGQAIPIYLHRVIAELAYGKTPDGLFVLHGDDDKSNFYPSNLRLGTQLHNMRDALRNGRLHVGEKNHRSKLTDSTVREIRSMVRSGQTHRAVAKQFGISQTSVTNVMTGHRWSHVAELAPPPS